MIDDLLELHEASILPALKRGFQDGAKLDTSVLKPIEDLLQKHTLLIPGVDKPTLADLCIAIDLLSYADISALPGPVAAFTEACHSHHSAIPAERI